jgi:hypothetical protein
VRRDSLDEPGEDDDRDSDDRDGITSAVCRVSHWAMLVTEPTRKAITSTPAGLDVEAQDLSRHEGWPWT